MDARGFYFKFMLDWESLSTPKLFFTLVNLNWGIKQKLIKIIIIIPWTANKEIENKYDKQLLDSKKKTC